MAKPILVANWKNYPGSLAEAQRLLRDIAKSRLVYKKLNFFIAPPMPYLDRVRDKAGGFSNLASQDMPLVDKGTYTGETTPEILKSFGVRLAIIGHSERRALGESNEEAAHKIGLALKAGITPLLCVGEKERDHEGVYFEDLATQIAESLAGVKKNDIPKVAIAYEPIWAIGKKAKDAIDPTDLSQTIIFIRKVLTDLYDRKIAEKVSILYGGSVEPSNDQDLWGTGIRGFLVGHASLNARELKDIAEELVS